MYQRALTYLPLLFMLGNGLFVSILLLRAGFGDLAAVGIPIALEVLRSVAFILDRDEIIDALEENQELWKFIDRAFGKKRGES